MADTLNSSTPRQIFVDSHDARGARNPDAGEVVTVSDQGVLTLAPADANGAMFVSVTAGAADQAVATIDVAPDAADVNASAGSDSITVTVSAPQVPLAVTLG